MPSTPQLQQQPMTPEQKKQFDLIVKQSLALLLDDQSAELLVSQAQTGDPQDVVADKVTHLLQQVTSQARAAGVELNIVTVMVAGVQIIGILAEMFEHVGILQHEELPQFMASTSDLAVKKQNEGAQAAGAKPEGPPDAPPAPQAPQGGGMINAPQGA